MWAGRHLERRKTENLHRRLRVTPEPARHRQRSTAGRALSERDTGCGRQGGPPCPGRDAEGLAELGGAEQGLELETETEKTPSPPSPGVLCPTRTPYGGAPGKQGGAGPGARMLLIRLSTETAASRETAFSRLGAL